MKIKIDVSQLKKGMYVCELDRPWTETSFLLQGIPVHGSEEILQLQQTCEYVFVDAEKSEQSLYPHLRSLSNLNQSKVIKGVSATHEAAQADLEQNNFKTELKVARKVHSRTRSFIDTALEDVRLGQAVNTQAAKELVTEVTNSITRSPHAMVWFTNIQAVD